MSKKKTLRFVSVFLLTLMLFSVLAVPIIAETTADSEIDGNALEGYAVFGYENVKISGSDLSGQFRYYSEAAIGSYRQGYCIQLEPDTWYYLKYTENIIMTGSSAPFYTFYRNGNAVFSHSGEQEEFVFYNGNGSGTCELVLFSADESSVGIRKYSLYQVASFDTVYDVRYTSFEEDHKTLFPEIDLSKYTGTSKDFIELITIYEDITIADDYTWDGHVYLYLFNPSGKLISGGTLTCPDDDGKSTAFSLVPVLNSNALAENNWRFMKLEVTGHWWHQYKKNEDGSPNIHSRKREITDLTMDYTDGSSRTFPYNGYFLIEDQLNDSGTESKTVTGNFESTVSLDINYTYYRTDTSPQGAYYHNQVDSIYFNVPNYLKESYGKLVDVKLSYQRVRTNPVIVTDNEMLYADLLASIGIDASSFNSGLPTLYHFDKQVNNQIIYDFTYNKNLNAPAGSQVTLISTQVCNPLWFAFLVDDVHAGIREAGSSVSRTEIEDWLYQYTEKFYPPSFIGPILGVQGAKGIIAKDFFSEVDDVTVVNVASLDLTADSYKTNHSFFSQWAEYGFFYAIGGTSTDVSLDLTEKIVPIEREWQLAGRSDTLYYAESDESALQNCFRKSIANDSTMYLVRFNVSQYRELPLSAELNGNLYTKEDMEPAYMAEQDLYLNLHVLELTYENEFGVKTVVPVTSNHIDCIADVTTEKTPENINNQAGQELGWAIGSFWQKLLDKLQDFGKILALILGVVLVVLLAVFVGPIVAPVFKAIFGVIGSFFRWIADKIKGMFAKRKQRKSGKKG